MEIVGHQAKNRKLSPCLEGITFMFSQQKEMEAW